MFKLLLLFVMLTTCCGSAIKRSTDTFVLKNATQFESPWLALIKIKQNGLICGGNLVKDRFLITAAHCFDGVNINPSTLKQNVKIRLGEWKTEMDPDCEDIDDSCQRVAEISPKKIVIHEHYKSNDHRRKHQSDIAIVMLAWPPRKSELIDNIDLTDKECGNNFEGEELFMTGFGKTPTSGLGYSKIKKSITVKIQPEKYCGENMKESFVREVHMCGIGTEGETTCSGDSGSGITSLTNDIPKLEGIVSYGVATCRESHKPSGFVNVACFVDWIDRKINEHLKPKRNQ